MLAKCLLKLFFSESCLLRKPVEEGIFLVTANHKLCRSRKDVASLGEDEEQPHWWYQFSLVNLFNELVEVPLPLDVIVVSRSPSFGNAGEAISNLYVYVASPSIKSFPFGLLNALW